MSEVFWAILLLAEESIFPNVEHTARLGQGLWLIALSIHVPSLNTNSHITTINHVGSLPEIERAPLPFSAKCNLMSRIRQSHIVLVEDLELALLL
jgi:hypothetical protein